MKVLHGGDQLPFGPHSDVVGWEKSVEDLESEWRGKLEILHGEADRRGALANHADVRRGSKQLEEARARILVEFKAQRQRIVPHLTNSESDSWAQDPQQLTVTCVVAGKRSSSIGSQRS
jgi:hypothetical protein